MATGRWNKVLILGGVGLLASLQSAPGQTGDKFSPKSDPQKVGQIIEYFKPRQENVDYTKPTPEEQKACTAKTIVIDNSGKGYGYVLFDPQGRPLRRLYFKDGSTLDTLSYYKDGLEAYREIDSNYNGKIDQYRWLNSGGSKLGIDTNEDGRIDAWRIISAEEVAHEVYQAVTTRDFARLRMLFITEEELRNLRLPEAQAARIRDNMAKAQVKLQELIAKTPALNNQPSYIGVDSVTPHCVPANAVIGPAVDFLRFPSRAIHYQSAGKAEWLHTGEMILVGQAWRLTDAPSVSDILEGPGAASGVPMSSPKLDPELDKLMKELPELDKQQPAWPGGVGKHPDVVAYTAKRVTLLEKIYEKTPDPKEKEIWLRQILDNLCTGHQANKGDNAFLNRLAAYKAQLTKSSSSLAGYAHYREMWARYAFVLAEGTDVKAMGAWTDELAKFVAEYPKADDAPDALWQLGMNSEFGGPSKVSEAKKYYGLIVTNFADHPLTPKAAGAVKRLDLNGKPMPLSAPDLNGKAFDLASLKNKVVVVYYWASNVNACVGDFARMRQMQTANAAKGVEIVSINLDETSAAAMSFLKSNPLPGTHLFHATEQARGLDSPLAIQYGIVTVPTIMLVGRDGRVIDHSIQINELEDALKKAL